MDKGIEVDDYLKFIKICGENDIRLHFNFILGWKNTNSSDVKEVDLFLNNLNKLTKPNTITANLYLLTLVEDRKIMSDYTSDEIIQVKTYYDAIVGEPKLDSKQLEIDEQIRNLYKDYPFMKLHDLSSNSSAHKKVCYGANDGR
jgi:hypothetical protein